MAPFLEFEFLNNTVENYLIALLTFFIGFFVVKIVNKIIVTRVIKFIKKKSDTADHIIIDAVKEYLPKILYVILAMTSIRTLDLSDVVVKGVNILALALSVYYVIKLALAFVDFSMQKYRVRHTVDSSKNMAMTWIAKILKAVILVIGVLIVIGNVIPDISGLIAGFGIGGIAVAFAAQEIFEDIFSYFTIFFDRPFEIGDFIIMGDYMGTVEYVGVRTTRIRSLSGEELIFSNKDLTSSRIKNFKTMNERRIVFSIGVTYDTPYEKLERIPTMLKDAVESQEDVRFDRAHFLKFADSSLNYEIVYYVLTGDYTIYMDKQQAINLAIFKAFEDEGIEFAFPTRTIYIESDGGDAKISNEKIVAEAMKDEA